MLERRYLSQTHSRVSIEHRDDGKPILVGDAAVFYRAGDSGTEFAIFDDLVERIMPGAFDSAMSRGDDVRALFNHSPELILGRTKSETLRLSITDRGLHYEIDLGDTTVARDVAEHVRRGDLTGSSFAFMVIGQEFRTENAVDIREITDVELFDVSPVTYPAYEGTTTGIRLDSSDDAVAAREAWRSGRAADRSEATARRARVVHTKMRLTYPL